MRGLETAKPAKLLLFLPLLLALSGCSIKSEVVFVDLDRVTAAETIPVPKAVPTPPPAATFPTTSLSLPALPGATYRLSSDKERVKQVQQIIQRNREQASLDIAARLRDTYMRDVRRVEAQKLAELDPAKQQRFANALGASNTVFQAYASKRGQLAAHLALLAGFPDRDPNSQRQPSGISPYIVKRFALAKSLRAQIAQLDKDYEAQVGKLMATVAEENAADVEKVRQQIVALRSQADQRAQQEAQKEVTKEQEQLRSALEDKSEVVFPAEPARTVTVQGSQKPPAPPTVDVPGKAEVQASLRAAIASDLKIWAAQNGYVVTASRSARNVTGEFIRWRQSHLVIR